MQDDDREVVCVQEQGVYGNSVLPAQFRYESKTAQKDSLYFKPMKN